MVVGSVRALYAPVLYAVSLWVKMLFWVANQAAELMPQKRVMFMPGERLVRPLLALSRRAVEQAHPHKLGSRCTVAGSR